MMDQTQYVKNEIDKKNDVIICYKSFLEIAALKYEEKKDQKEELLSELKTVARKNFEMEEKGKLCEEDIRHEGELRRRVNLIDNVMDCYRWILNDLEKSLNRVLSGNGNKEK